MEEERKFYTAPEVQKILRLAKSTVYRYIRTGIIPSFKAGKKKVVYAEVIEGFHKTSMVKAKVIPKKRTKVQKVREKKKTPLIVKEIPPEKKPEKEICFLFKIKIPVKFLRNPPTRKEIVDTIRFYKKHGEFDDVMTVDRNNMRLIDGYKYYIAAKELGLYGRKVKFID